MNINAFNTGLGHGERGDSGQLPGVYDELTHSYTRFFYQNKINQRIIDSLDQGEILNALLININQFAKVNNFYSLQVGDSILVSLCVRIREFFNHQQILIRMNGDEFLVLINKEITSEQIKSFHQKLSAPHYINDRVFECNIRLAYLLGLDKSFSVDNLYTCLADSINFAKVSRLNIVEFDTKHCELSYSRLDFPVAIQKLFDDDKFLIVLQPIGTALDQVMGYEVLVRLDLDGNVLNPDIFLDYVMENGFSSKLNLLVMNKVILLLQHECWRRLLSVTRLKISINLAPSVENFLFHVEELIRVYTTNKNLFENVQLEFEITENQFMPDDLDNPAFFRQLLEKVHKSDIRLALDDFGVAYSSLQRLMECRFDTVKLDMSFVRALNPRNDNYENSLAVFEALKFYAEKMNIDLVVEGVETIEQLRILQRIGYKYFQGYILGQTLTFTDACYLHLEKWTQS